MFLQDKASKQAKEKHNIEITGAIYNCDFTRWKSKIHWMSKLKQNIPNNKN